MSLYAVKKSIVNLIPGRLVRVFAAPYVSGDSLDKGLAVADRLFEERGIHTTLDVLGEAEKTEAKVRGAVENYLRALEAVKTRGYCTLSIKPGHFGFYVSPDLCRRNVEEMAAACQAAGRGLTVDMEDTDLTDFTLDLYRDLKPKYPILGTVLQSRLHRTLDDVDRLDGLNAHVRACIGIYNVGPDKALTNRRQMKENLLLLIEKLLDRGHYVCVATHDMEYLAKARDLLRRKAVLKDRYEFQMLLGVPRDRVQKELVAAGETVRLYVPFASDWDDAIAYLRRRMLESPSMSLLVLKNLFVRGH
ncbi:MAG: proline dehydrogenase family protein [Acidobacteriota bacterium]